MLGESDAFLKQLTHKARETAIVKEKLMVVPKADHVNVC